MTLWFENKYEEEREIAKVNTWEDISKEINKFINKCNERNRAGGAKEFKSYYMRTWKQEDGRYRIDVGSYSEFFITDLSYGEKKNDNECSSKDLG